jgi:signal peptidase II
VVGFLLPALIVVLLDQVSKQFFWALGRNFDVIDNLVRITLVRNSGAAFGLLQQGRVFLIVASVTASIFIMFLAERMPEEERAKRLFLGMILGGALGNLIDRLYPGHVIDFIEVGIASYRWPVFNLADSAVTIGGFLLVLTFFLKRGPKPVQPI